MERIYEVSEKGTESPILSCLRPLSSPFPLLSGLSPVLYVPVEDRALPCLLASAREPGPTVLAHATRSPASLRPVARV